MKYPKLWQPSLMYSSPVAIAMAMEIPPFSLEFPSYCQNPNHLVDRNVWRCSSELTTGGSVEAPIHEKIQARTCLGLVNHITIRWMGQQNPAPVDQWFIHVYPIIYIGFQPSKVVQDFATIHSINPKTSAQSNIQPLLFSWCL